MKNRFNITATIYDKRGHVVAKAVNSYTKTHPKQATYAKRCGEGYKQVLHAEVAAIIKARGKGVKIKVERYDNKGNPRNAKPCPICELAIKEAGIEYVEYTVGV